MKFWNFEREKSEENRFKSTVNYMYNLIFVLWPKNLFLGPSVTIMTLDIMNGVTIVESPDTHHHLLVVVGWRTVLTITTGHLHGVLSRLLSTAPFVTISAISLQTITNLKGCMGSHCKRHNVVVTLGWIKQHWKDFAGEADGYGNQCMTRIVTQSWSVERLESHKNKEHGNWRIWTRDFWGPAGFNSAERLGGQQGTQNKSYYWPFITAEYVLERISVQYMLQIFEFKVQIV